jgi:hypothetical protein
MSVYFYVIYMFRFYWAVLRLYECKIKIMVRTYVRINFLAISCIYVVFIVIFVFVF